VAHEAVRNLLLDRYGCAEGLGRQRGDERASSAVCGAEPNATAWAVVGIATVRTPSTVAGAFTVMDSST